MSTAVFTARLRDTAPRFKARITGVFYLLTMLTGIFAQGFVSGRLVVDGDAAATAASILAHKSLFQWGFTVYLIEMACQIAMTALFYDLLKPVGRSVSLLAAFLGFAGCVIKTFSRVFFFAPLFILGGAHYLNVFSMEQLQALALLFLKVNDHGAAMALVFFGFYALLTGYLIIRSTFLPRILGVWSAIAGLGWLSFLYPTLGYRLFFYVAPFGLLGAVALIVWLLVFGVNEQRWREQARAAGERWSQRAIDI
jgi:MFS family permease